MTKNCRNCWFYCQSDGRCYADPRSVYDENYSLRYKTTDGCSNWAFDGLEDWEREACEPDALVTMELEAA